MSARTGAAALVAAAAIAGCGGTNSDNGLDDALSFVPKGSPVVATVATDPDGGQWEQVDKLARKFPFSGQFKSGFKQRFGQRAGVDFDRDAKPLLGNEAVLAYPSMVVALKVDDQAAAEAFVKKQTSAGRNVALRDGVVVATATRPGLQAALERHGTDDHMTDADLSPRLAGLDRDALLTVGIDPRTLIPRDARAVKWLATLRNVGVALIAKSDGVELDFNTASAGGLTATDLPLAPGPQAPPVARRPADLALAMRDLGQTIRFGEAVARASDPAGFAAYRQRKARLTRQLGVDVARDLEGDAALAVGADGSVAFRSQLRDGRRRQAGGFHPITTPNGRRYVAGVVGGRLVLATGAGRAAQFAQQQPEAVPGAEGALTVAADARSLANEALRRRGQGTAAMLFTAALGDLSGSIESETEGLEGHLRLEIK